MQLCLGKVVSIVTKQRKRWHPNGNVYVCMLCLCVRVYGLETKTEDIISSLSGRAIVCQEGLYCQPCQNYRISRDIPTEMYVCVCACRQLIVTVLIKATYKHLQHLM